MKRTHLFLLITFGLATSSGFTQDRHSMYPFEATEYEPAQFSYGVGPDTGEFLFNKPAQAGETQWAEIAPIFNQPSASGGAELGASVDPTSRPDAATMSGATVFFPFDSSEAINPEVLRTIPGLLESKILLTGRTDPVGTDAYNDALSKRRAESVAAHLVQLGVSRSYISVEALGSRSPLGDVTTQEGKAFNRQVRVHLKERF